jgi:hypothetical protein
VIIASGKVNARDREGRLTGDPKIITETLRLVEYDTAKAYQQKHGQTTAAVPDPLPATRTAPPAPKVPIVTLSETPVEGQVVLRLDDLGNQQTLIAMKTILGTHTGAAEVYVVTGAESRRIRLPFRVDPSAELLTKLEALLGAGSVSREN